MRKPNHIITVLAFLVLSFCACEKDISTEDPILPPGTTLPGNENQNRIENPYWAWAQKFPGNVEDTVVRLQNVQITIDGNYTPWTETLISVRPSAPLVSTGLYAPVAEIITIQVPEGISGLKYQIGIYSCQLSDTATRARYSKITATGKLIAGENKIYNYFGGHLYITFTYPIAVPFDLTISGAVKSPDFVLGKTDPETWKKEIAATGVPWGEISCKNMIMTMPVKELRKVQDPVALMQFYEEYIEEDFDIYSGLSKDAINPKHRSPQFPWRYNTDLQLCLGAGHNGYPFVGGMDWAAGSLNLQIMLDGNWGVYHELGHNYQTNTWKWDAIGEVSNNLHVYHMMNRKFQKWHPRDINFEYAVETYINNPENTTWTFDSLDVFHKLTPFLQIAQEYGWKFYSYLAKEGRENGTLSTDQEKINFFARKLTEYSHYDQTSFFRAWHLFPTAQTEAYMHQFEPVPTRYWETFNRENVPSDFTEHTPLKKDEPEMEDIIIDRSVWTVSTSSNRPGSPAMYIIDNDVATYWYADWSQPATQIYPHWMQMDLKQATEFNYVYFVQSTQYQNSSRPCKVSISVSNNGTTWTLLKTIKLEKTSGVKQSFDVDKTTARYIKIDMITPHPDSGKPLDTPKQAGTATMAEFGLGRLEFK